MPQIFILRFAKFTNTLNNRISLACCNRHSIPNSIFVFPILSVSSFRLRQDESKIISPRWHLLGTVYRTIFVHSDTVEWTKLYFGLGLDRI